MVVIQFFKRCMTPTTKLVTDIVASEACYLNTGHPDFISGHKAMAIVNERMNPASAQPVDPKKNGVNAVNNDKDLDVNIKDNQGFFGSFFAGGKQQQNKQKRAAMEAVSKA